MKLTRIFFLTSSYQFFIFLYSSSALNSDVFSDELTTAQPEEEVTVSENVSTVNQNMSNTELKKSRAIATQKESIDKLEDQFQELPKKYEAARAAAPEISVKENYEVSKASNENDGCNCSCEKKTNNCKEKQLLRRKMETRKKSSEKLNLSQEEYYDYDVDDNKSNKNYYEEKINQHKNKAIFKTKSDSSSFTVDTDDSTKVKTQYHSSKSEKNSERIKYKSNKQNVEQKERIHKNLQRSYADDYYDDENTQDGQDDYDNEQSMSSNEASYEREKKRRVIKKKIIADTDESVEYQRINRRKKIQQHKKAEHQKGEDDEEKCIKVYHLEIPPHKCCTKNYHQHANRHSACKFNEEELSVEDDYLIESNSGRKYVPADDYPVNICNHCRREFKDEKLKNKLRCDSCGIQITK